MTTATSSGVCPLPPSGGGLPLGRGGNDTVRNARKILVIDDSRVVLKVTAYKLRGYGYEVHTAEDGATAIRKLREVRPDLLLLDLNFPPDVANGGGVPWDGLMLLDWLRRMNEAQGIPVIAITAGTLPNYQQRCLEAGVLDIFLKPLDHEALAEAIRKTLDASPRKLELTAQPDQPDPEGAPVAGGHQAGPESKPELPTSAQPESEPATRKRILFVDDESDWRYMGELYLKECGYDVVTTADAVGALVQVSIFKPHLIVLDLNLGGQSGVTLLKLLAEAHSELPVLIYTGAELDDEKTKKLLSQGAFDCLRKGTMDELMNAVRRILGDRPVKSGVFSKATDDQEVPSELQEETAPGAPAVHRSASAPPPQPIEGVAGPANGAAGVEAQPDATLGKSVLLIDACPGALPDGMEPRPQAQSEPVQEVVESRGASLLVISEDRELGESLCSALESQPFKVTRIADGNEALSQLGTAEVDLILFDLAAASPSVDQFYHGLETINPLLCRRTIFITSDDAPPSADGFVRRVRGLSLWKPFPVAELLEMAQTIQDRNAAAPSAGNTAT